MKLRRGVLIQKLLSRLFLIPVYFFFWFCMRVVMRYRVPAIRSIRRQFRSLMAESDRPAIICANHLTLVDSMVLVWAMGSPGYYLRHFSHLPWNLPERNNFWHNIFSRLCCYLGKCVPVIRGGTQSQRSETFEKVGYLLSSGDTVMIFPEGTRSRKGLVDVETFGYAVGRFLQTVPNARVICFYLRGQGQRNFSDYPRYKEIFYTHIKEIFPKTSFNGMRGARDLSTQIVRRLAEMEKGYFEHESNDRQ